MSTTTKKRVCCVRGCSAILDNVREALFVFPSNKDLRGKRWLEMFPHSFIRHPTAENYICGRHFTAECFNKDGALYHRADPTVNIDTSYAQDPMKKTFLFKVIYELALRNSIDFDSGTNLLLKKATAAKSYLGIPNLTIGFAWYAKFMTFKDDLQCKGTRFGSGQKGPKQMLGIIKDIRSQMPSNISLPADYMETTTEDDPLKIKEEENEDLVSGPTGVPLNSIFENEESVDEPIQSKDVVPLKSLDTYQEALDLLQPLRDYIRRTGNDSASSRLREIETVVKQAIKSETKPRRAPKRRR